MIFVVSMTPSTAPPSSLVTRVQLSRTSSEAYLAVTSPLSGSMGYLSAAGAASGSAPAPWLVPAQPASPMNPAATADPARKSLLVIAISSPFCIGAQRRQLSVNQRIGVLFSPRPNPSLSRPIPFRHSVTAIGLPMPYACIGMVRTPGRHHASAGEENVQVSID